jgi:hypothetical protein
MILSIVRKDIKEGRKGIKERTSDPRPVDKQYSEERKDNTDEERKDERKEGIFLRKEGRKEGRIVRNDIKHNKERY